MYSGCKLSLRMESVSFLLLNCIFLAVAFLVHSYVCMPILDASLHLSQKNVAGQKLMSSRYWILEKNPFIF